MMKSTLKSTMRPDPIIGFNAESQVLQALCTIQKEVESEKKHFGKAGLSSRYMYLIIYC